MARTPTDPNKAQVWITKGLDDLDFEFYFPQGPKGDPGGWNQGTNLGNTNLNAFLTPGLYTQPAVSSATLANNYPVAGQVGVLEVIAQTNNSAVLQRFTRVWSAGYEAKIFYQRTYYNSVWTPWETFTSLRTDQTAGRTIYAFDTINNREQMIYGDTGRRNISSLIPTAVSGQVLLARQNNTVMLILADFLDSSPNTNVNWNGLIPVGFRPQNWIYMPIPSSRTMTIQNGGNVTCVSGGVTPNTTVYQGCLTWRTEEAWPTTLPGVAVGSIPA